MPLKDYFVLLIVVFLGFLLGWTLAGPPEPKPPPPRELLCPPPQVSLYSQYEADEFVERSFYRGTFRPW